MAVEVPHPVPTDALLARLLALYDEADRRLRRTVADAIARGALGTAAHRKAQLRQVERILRQLRAMSTPLEQAVIQGTYRASALAVDVALPRAAIDRGFAFAGVHQDAVAVLVDQLANRTDAASALVGRKVDDLFRRVGLEETAQGIVVAGTRREVTAALARRLAGEGVVGFVDRRGAQWGLGAYARMVARTTTRQAMSAALANRMSDHGEDLIEISEHGADDEACADYEGNTYSLTGATPGYEVIDELPPFHPNCVHVATPAAATFETFMAGLSSQMRGVPTEQVQRAATRGAAVR